MRVHISLRKKGTLEKNVSSRLGINTTITEHVLGSSNEF